MQVRVCIGTSPSHFHMAKPIKRVPSQLRKYVILPHSFFTCHMDQRKHCTHPYPCHPAPFLSVHTHQEKGGGDGAQAALEMPPRTGLGASPRLRRGLGRAHAGSLAAPRSSAHARPRDGLPCACANGRRAASKIAPRLAAPLAIFREGAVLAVWGPGAAHRRLAVLCGSRAPGGQSRPHLWAGARPCEGPRLR